MNSKYEPNKIEGKWQKKWEEDQVHRAEIDADKKKYILDMFPYPSGDGLHVGHVRGYTASDILSRYYRMNGYSVLHPMGWDAFGLPAENAAIKQKTLPQKIIPGYIANFKAQMQALGLSYDWSREFMTTDPNYYKWTQWLFIQFFKMGLLTKKETPIYFCPVCQTGLAQEEVLEDGTHERCGNKVEERTLPQWIFRITKYADRLLDDLEGLDWPAGIIEQQKNWIGKKQSEDGSKTIYHLRDWIFSRQRYWGEPIPMVHCAKCAEDKVSYWDSNNLEIRNSTLEIGNKDSVIKSDVKTNIQEWTAEIKSDLNGWFPVPEEDLPVKLPEVDSYQATTTGRSPLSEIEEFVNTICPNCGGAATRETDTMPNWAGSCWYFIYFSGNNIHQNDKKNNATNLENWKLKIENSANHWLPVDWYIGGAEHAVLHLLYARFWMKAMYDLDLVKALEPFTKLNNVGLIIAEDGRKMSKSFGNVINPNEIVNQFGADTLRLFEMFLAPFSQEVAWSSNAIAGSSRFLARIWQMYQSFANITINQQNEDLDLAVELQKLVLTVSEDITNVKFNTAISSMMVFLNHWEEKESAVRKGQNADDNSYKTLSHDSAKIFLKLVAPFAPHLAEELWYGVFDAKSSIHLEAWPQPKAVQKSSHKLTIPVQVDGRIRDVLIVENNDISESTIVDMALQSEKVKKWVEGKKYQVIYKEGKILNLVTE